MDTISIQDVELWTHIGVPDEERQKEQRLLVSLWIPCDTYKAGKEDDITSSVNYQKVLEELQELGKTERKTIERFANEVADHLLQKFALKKITVHVRKFPWPGESSVSITIDRP